MPGLHEDIGVDFYPVYSLHVVNNNLVAFGAFFATEDNRNDNVGQTIMFWLGKVHFGSTMDELI
jgi:hypothetical protein